MIFIRFGSRGASVTFSQTIRSNCSENDFFILTRTAQDIEGENVLFLEKETFSKFIVSSIKIMFFLLKSNKTAVILMPSPIDWICILKKGGIKTIKVIVHDDKPHKGDRFFKELFAQSFWKIMKPEILTLTNYVSTSLKSKGYNTLGTLFHPYFNTGAKVIKWESRKYDIGIFGRFKSYQGTSDLDWIRDLIHKNGLSVVYCGGEKNIFKNTMLNEKHVNGKISDDDFFKYMADTRYVFLPYIEATQSGIIPNAIALGCKIITTKVGGIPEQDLHNDFKFVELKGSIINQTFNEIRLSKRMIHEIKIFPDEISPTHFLKSLKEKLNV